MGQMLVFLFIVCFYFVFDFACWGNYKKPVSKEMLWIPLKNYSMCGTIKIIKLIYVR